jgi:hypothetical protein
MENYHLNEPRFGFYQRPDVEKVVTPKIDLICAKELATIMPRNQPFIIKVLCDDLQPADETNICVLADINGQRKLACPPYELHMKLKMWKNKEKTGKPDYEIRSTVFTSKYSMQYFPSIFPVTLVVSYEEEDVRRCCIWHKPKFWSGKKYLLYFDHSEPKEASVQAPAIRANAAELPKRNSINEQIDDVLKHHTTASLNKTLKRINKRHEEQIKRVRQRFDLKKQTELKGKTELREPTKLEWKKAAEENGEEEEKEGGEEEDKEKEAEEMEEN